MHLTLGRPQNEEAAPHYFNYINQVSGDDPLSVLEQQLGECLREFAQISEQKSLHRYAPEKWSIREVLNHVSDLERVFAFRALWFARGFQTALPSYEQTGAVSAAEANRISWAAHVEEFRGVRLATLSLFRNLPAAAWMRNGIASDHRFSVRAFPYIIAGHLAHHVALLRERYR
jgi:DinB superfamily